MSDPALPTQAVTRGAAAVPSGSPEAIKTQEAIHQKIAHLYSIERVNATVFNRAFNNYFNRLVLSMMPADRGVRVLDLMGGTGLLTHALFSAGYRNVVLADLSLDMLRYARGSLGAAARPCAGDAMQLPLPDGSFDVVICRGGLHHLPDLAAGVREVARVLKRHGRFLAFDPCDDLRAVRWVRRIMYRMFSFFDDEHEHGLTSRELGAALAAAGLAVQEMRKFGFVGYTASGVEAHLFPRLFAHLPRWQRLGAWVCRIDESLEGSAFLLATSVRAMKA